LQLFDYGDALETSSVWQAQGVTLLAALSSGIGGLFTVHSKGMPRVKGNIVVPIHGHNAGRVLMALSLQL